MVYFTGDIHGQVEDVRTMINSHNITPNDIIVLLGDVGLAEYRDGELFRISNHACFWIDGFAAYLETE